jgi:hypothetical protein
MDRAGGGMTARVEDEPRVLIFADILGFQQMTREIRVRRGLSQGRAWLHR